MAVPHHGSREDPEDQQQRHPGPRIANTRQRNLVERPVAGKAHRPQQQPEIQADHLDRGPVRSPKTGVPQRVIDIHRLARRQTAQHRVAHQREDRERRRHRCIRRPAPHDGRLSLGETEVPKQHQAQQNGGVLFGEDSDGGDGEQGCRRPTALTSYVEQQAAEHRHGRQQVGAAHDAGDGLGADGMDRPQRGGKEGRPGAAEQQQRQFVEQPDVDRVQ